MDDSDTLHKDKAGNLRHMTVVDPSDAVTGLGFIFGAVGAVIGIIAAIILSPSFSLAMIGYCLLAAFAGASAGIVTGGMVGAIFAVIRGVSPPTARGRPR